MATLNCYPVDPGKPMVHNKATAERFFRCCKQPIRFRRSDGKFIEIQHPEIRCVGVYEIGNSGIGMDIVSWWIKDEGACVDWIWQHRKMINDRFRGE